MAYGRVYSTQLVAVQGLSGILELTADAGALTVLRCFDAYWGGGIDIISGVRLIGSSGQTIFEDHVRIPGTDPLAHDSRWWGWRGRQIIFGGETWAVEAAGGEADISVSGYLLRDVAP